MRGVILSLSGPLDARGLVVRLVVAGIRFTEAGKQANGGEGGSLVQGLQGVRGFRVSLNPDPGFS